MVSVSERVDPEIGEKSKLITFTSRLKKFKMPQQSHFMISVKKIAFTDIAISVFFIFYIGFQYPSWRKLKQPSVIFFLGWYVTYMIVSLLLSFLLICAAISKNCKNLVIWIMLSFIIFAVWISIFACHWITFGLSWHTSSLFSVLSIFKAYSFFVIYSFVKSLDDGAFLTSKANKNTVTEKIIREFVHGVPAAKVTSRSTAMFEVKPYDTKAEVSFERLTLDAENFIYKGEFNIIMKGNLTYFHPDRSNEIVAVKTICDTVNNSYFKAALSDLKCLAGTRNLQHPNVVVFIGACTSKIRSRNLQIIMEYCPFGDLHNFIKSRKHYFVTWVKDGEVSAYLAQKEYSNVQSVIQNQSFTTHDLFKWSLEICQGLNHLAKQGIVHARLESRNILLSFNRVAKISDTGLAKQLYHCGNAATTEQAPPSWRWLALESLKAQRFSTSSDIWQLGVTIWEMFSLGEPPFPGLAWSSDFTDFLARGLRMKMPLHATHDIYNILLECWEDTPEKRPTPSELIDFFRNLLDKLKHIYSMKYIATPTTTHRVYTPLPKKK